MNFKQYNRKKIVRLIHNIFVIILFVWLDLLIIRECENSMRWSAENDDIFGAALDPFFSFIMYTPFFISQLIYFFGSNSFLKQRTVSAPKSSKYCILTATVIASLIILIYLSLAFMQSTRIYFLKVSNDVLILGSWAGPFASLALYSVGKLLAMRKVKPTNDIT